MLPPRLRIAIRKFDRKAAQLLGFNKTRKLHDSESEHEDVFVWDVSDPFAPPDPADERLRGLIQAEITRMRRYESFGPLQSLPYDDSDDSDYDDSDSGDGNGYSTDSGNWTDSDADADSEDDPTTTTTITLPKLLHTQPICGFITSNLNEDHDLAEAEEQERARKAKRDAHRSRLKAIAVLGPEAASAF